MRTAVIGAGAWGTALAHLLASKGEEVVIWAYEEEVSAEINAAARNSVFLPGVKLREGLWATSRLPEAVNRAEAVVLVTPSQVLRQVATRLSGHLPPEALIISASKGIEEQTLLTMTGVLSDILGPGAKNRLAVLSGPSFAQEVARRAPTAVTCAAFDEAAAHFFQRLFWTDWFRVYTSSDVVGVELGGALKNVMAIAAGICQGLNLGHNTLAALITRGLAEISRLGVTLGADPLTFLGLAGVGDLVLTCTSAQSRNHTVGLKLGQGLDIEEILSGMKAVAEGVRTTRSAHDLARERGAEMPICDQVHAVIYGGRPPEEALSALMSRDPKLERWGLE